MLSCMRTTLNLDDGLIRAAKQRAVEEGRTLTSLVEEGLRQVLLRQPPAAEPVDLPAFGRDGLQPGIRLDDPAALRDIVHADEDAAFRSARGDVAP